jgi:nucleotide-binding universal stress UspA family protein
MSARPRQATSPIPHRVHEKRDGPCLVVGYDGSESARAAASWAAGSLPGDGRLVLVYACRPLHAPPSPLASADERYGLGRAFLDELALDGEDALLDAHTEVSDEDPVSALTEAARRHRASGIVVGCEQHSRMHKARGTVTSELLMRSPVPVTAVPSHTAERRSVTALPSRVGERRPVLVEGAWIPSD